MSLPNVFQGDLLVQGSVSAAGTIFLPNGTITDVMVAALGGGSPGIQASKLQHEIRQTYSQEAATTVAAETRVLFIARAVGSLQSFKAGLVGACSGSTPAVTFDLKKSTSGGAFASVLSATLSFGTGDAARSTKSATISSAAYVAGDIFEVVITASAGGGTLGTGAFATVDSFEAAQ